ncbi:MAG: hypothetical protein RL199_1788 [Pseudomonadota bacterium]|jgi:hypothetical protein
MGAVEQTPVEAAALSLRVAYRRAEELIADHLRWFRMGLLPPVPGDVGRLELELAVTDGPTLQLCAERAPEGGWRFHPGDGGDGKTFEEAVHALAVRTFGERWTRQLETMPPLNGHRLGPPGPASSRPVSEVGRRRPR